MRPVLGKSKLTWDLGEKKRRFCPLYGFATSRQSQLLASATRGQQAISLSLQEENGISELARFGAGGNPATLCEELSIVRRRVPRKRKPSFMLGEVPCLRTTGKLRQKPVRIEQGVGGWGKKENGL